MATAFRTGAKWADADDEDDDELEPQNRRAFETLPDDQGIKVSVEYTDRDGKTYKITRKVKQTNTPKWSNAAIIARKDMPKFGKAAIVDEATNAKCTSKTDEEVFIEFSKKNAALAVTNDAEDKFLEESLNVCESLTKQKKSWTDAQRDKHTEPEGPVGGEAQPAAAAAPAPGAPGTTGRYLPPGLRSGAGKGDGKGKSGGDQEASLRITNLSEDAKEGDLQDLFGQFGRLQRVFLSKDMATGLSKGFAFITYYSRDDAQKAMNKLNGHGYDNLILQVQWAKPRA